MLNFTNAAACFLILALGAWALVALEYQQARYDKTNQESLTPIRAKN